MADYDLAIIGGGINGVGIARDAAGRGLRVLLVEMNDLASGTSSASSKLVHGGLRYLEHGAFRLVREALTEREVLPRIALGPAAFYGTDGRIQPSFRVHMDLQKEFAADLRKLSNQAHDLRLKLETVRNSK